MTVSSVGLVNDAQARVARLVIAHNLEAAISGAVVHDNDLDIAVGLRKYRIETLR